MHVHADVCTNIFCFFLNFLDLRTFFAHQNVRAFLLLCGVSYFLTVVSATFFLFSSINNNRIRRHVRPIVNQRTHTSPCK